MTNILQRPLRVGLIGAGYIASWHLDALRGCRDASVTAVCDPAADAATALAAAAGVPAFASVEDLIAAQVCDAVHILTPPQTHRALALQCLSAGLHVLVEKPLALTAAEAQELAAVATAAGRTLGTCHNFLGQPAYARLRNLQEAGTLGRIGTAEITWAYPLSPLRSGPYGLWLLRDPGNLLSEIGPHPFAFAVDLFGPLTVLAATQAHPVTLPGGGERHQTFRILARAGATEIAITIALTEVMDDRSVTLRGSSGVARLDYAADRLTLARDNTAELILNPLWQELSQAGQHLREGARNAARQALSLNRKSPYALGFAATLAAFYGAIRRGLPPDPRFAPATAIAVKQAIDAARALLPGPLLPAPAKVLTARPQVMVIGGTGYIGRALTRALVADGHAVRVLSRGRSGPFDDISDRVETVGVSLTDTAALAAAMAGCTTVFNLARALEKTWEAALAQDVGTAQRIAEAAVQAGVGRLIHTGTIASYDMSDPAAVITEATDFGDLSARNLYARSKAEGEARLTAFCREYDLPLVIARPGIVVGGDGPLQHWGVGRWHGAGAVRLWGRGRNPLPFVLNDDVARGLILMMEADAAPGQSFNLVGDPLLSARGYFDAIHARTGARVHVTSGAPGAMWAADALKYALKRHALGRRDAVRASLADWRSRGHLARFDNALPKRLLGWAPESDRDRLVARAIDAKALFGF